MIYYEKTKGKIDFVFWGQDYWSAKKWVSDIDQYVFTKQLETGIYEPLEEIPARIYPPIFEMMMHAWEQGYIAPEYGCTGGRGIHQFHFTPAFTPAGKFCYIEVYHPYVGEKWHIRSQVNITDRPQVVIDLYPFQYSANMGLCPKIHSEDRAVQLDEKKDLIGIACDIWGQEYATLRNWDWWREEKAFSGCYEYVFRPTTVGTAVRVNDLEHDKSKDISDYGSW